MSAPPALSRRALGKGLLAAPVALAAVPVAAAPAPDPVLRDATLRGLALAAHRGDGVGAKAAARAMAALTDTDPEGALLVRLYRRLDVLPSQSRVYDPAPARPDDLAVLHAAIAASTPVAFGYTDLEGQPSQREVWPLVLVHPSQGVKLLAWCLKAEGFRQFFVRQMRDLTPRPGGFADRRMALLQALAEKEGA